MSRLLKFIINYQLKQKYLPSSRRNSGFTLLELLVGLAMALLILTPLLGFVINIMNSDRQEQAKNTSDQEIQAALDYISRDVQQAIYIYDGNGLKNNSPTGIKNQLPLSPDTDKVPVLVFWKRKVVDKVVPTGNPPSNCTNNPDRCNDAFIYSLVAYYLIKDAACTASNTWSCTARIGRVEISDGIVDPTDPTNPGNPPTPKYITGRPPDSGFKLFKLDALGDTLEAKMNAWTKNNVAYSNTLSPAILIDYVDQTPNSASGVPSPACPVGNRPGVTPATPLWRRTPEDAAIAAQFRTSSFYACVNTTDTTAKVFIRGNALARTQQKANPPNFRATQSAYFPTASIQVAGRGFLDTSK